ARGQGYVVRVPSNFYLTVARGVRLTCKQAATQLAASGRSWEIRSAGKGSKGSTLVCVGVAGHQLAPALPAHPPPPGHRRAALPLLPYPRWTAAVAVTAGARRRAEMAGGGWPPLAPVKLRCFFMGVFLVPGQVPVEGVSSGRGCRSQAGV